MDFGFALVPALLWVIVTSMAWVASTAEATPTTTSSGDHRGHRDKHELVHQSSCWMGQVSLGVQTYI